MKVFTESKKERTREGVPPIAHDPLRHGRPIPPHERRSLIRIDFDDADWNLLIKIFSDEDTAIAATEIIKNAPPEIQILAIQLMNIIKEED